MNKIYALKYCYITNTVKVVSELARRVCKGVPAEEKDFQYLPLWHYLYYSQPLLVHQRLVATILTRHTATLQKTKGSFRLAQQTFLFLIIKGN